jgi:hypothetical protein
VRGKDPPPPEIVRVKVRGRMFGQQSTGTPLEDADPVEN